MADEGLGIVISCLAGDFRCLREASAESLGQARKTEEGIDDLEARLTVLKHRLGKDSRSAASHTQPVPQREAEQPTSVARKSWNTIRQEAENHLWARGIQLGAVDLDSLLDPQAIRQIEERFSGGFSIETHLDRYDVMTAVAAGLVAGLVDFLIVKIPKDIVYMGEGIQEGSPLTEWLHSIEIPADNWLAGYFRTSYDKVREVAGEIPGFSPRTHRLQSLGHDPLVGLVIGTIDVMRGGLTAMSRGGDILFLTDTGTAHYNPFTALVWQIMHLLSDLPTRMGIPAPGFSLLQLFSAGSFGERERTVAELARWMYLNGYDTRHFLTMSASVAAAEIVLRGYFWARRKMDDEYEAEVAHEGRVAGAEKTGAHPRFQGMAFMAHGIAAAANAGKVAVYGGNPLAINYAQWLRFLHAMCSWLQGKSRSPSDVIIGHAYAGWWELEQGWPALDVRAEDFPTLIVHSGDGEGDSQN